jgi:hypothetical protein
MSEPTVPISDIHILQKLARRKREIASHPVNLERKELWYRHDRGESCRPLVLAEHGGIHPTAAGFGLIARQWLAAGARA